MHNEPTQPSTYTAADPQLMRSVIQRVATGPELSKNISYEEARAVTNAILDGSADPVQAAVFLIGLRMKRETDDEVKGVLDALREQTVQVKTDCKEVVAMSEPYNGFNRTLQGSLFVLPVLAACGVSVYSHGVELGGPKFGVTHHTTLRALGGNPLASVDETRKRLEDPDIGWGYIDQSVFCPNLHAQTDLRIRIVKRPVFSTTEVLLSPLTGAEKTHLVTGYVHKPYRDVYSMLAKHAGFDTLLLVRGTEGGVIPSFRSRAHVVRYTPSIEQTELDIELEELDLLRDYRAEDVPDDMTPATPSPDTIGMVWDIESLAGLCAKKGRNALQGETGAIQDAAVLGAALVLWHSSVASDMQEATRMAREAINSGKAYQHLQAGLATNP